MAEGHHRIYAETPEEMAGEYRRMKEAIGRGLLRAWTEGDGSRRR